MALTLGRRLGPYEVSAQIGVGGVGEVYRATDTNLKRRVVIKALPTAVAADAERLARFQREAERTIFGRFSPVDDHFRTAWNPRGSDIRLPDGKKMPSWLTRLV